MNTWRDNVRRVVPYVPGEQPKAADLIKLNTNENPYPPAPGVAEALRGFGTETLRKYPDPSCTQLTAALAERYGVSPERIFTGVGSDDVLAMAFLTFFHSNKPVLFPDVTYSFYDVWADLYGIPYERVPLDASLKIVPGDYRRENGGIIFPNPNAPTGLAMPLSGVEEILAANPGSLVIVDEAYVDFGAESALSLLDRYDNLLVVQTFSKSRSLAGIRIGFAIGSKEMISCLWAVRNSFNSYTMSNLTCAVGAASLANEAYFQETVKRIVATREKAKERFAELGFSFGDSKANFLFVTHPELCAKTLFEDLRARNIYVRYFGAERTKDYLRITIGTDREMEILFDFLENYRKKCR